MKNQQPTPDSTGSAHTELAPPSRSRLRVFLRLLSLTLSLLMMGALVLALVGWRKSKTPLPPAVENMASAAQAQMVQIYRSGDLYFPGEQWPRPDPAALGWDKEALEAARRIAEGFDTSSLIVLHRGAPIALWGDLDRRENSQSMRKALTGALIGRLVHAGELELEATLAELGIDDQPPLTALEQSATLEHLLLSRSAIYRSAVYEAGGWKRRKPKRGSSAPGEEWYYNNWGFNALSTIYREVAGQSVAESFAQHIAQPLGMQDFRARDVVTLTKSDFTERLQGNQSEHGAEIFMISARDLARFGLLYLADGSWQGQQVVPSEWVHHSMGGRAQAIGYGDRRYGYLWWVDPAREALPYASAVASGGRGHKLVVVPALELVVVHRIPDGGVGLFSQLFRRFVWHASVTDEEFDGFLRALLEAMPEPPAPTPEPPPAQSSGASVPVGTPPGLSP